MVASSTPRVLALWLLQSSTAFAEEGLAGRAWWVDGQIRPRAGRASRGTSVQTYYVAIQERAGVASLMRGMLAPSGVWKLGGCQRRLGVSFPSRQREEEDKRSTAGGG